MIDSAQFDDELLSAYLDDELSAEERARVDARLASDPAARQLLDELRSVSQAMQGLPHAKLGDDLRDGVLRRAERAMLVDDNDGANDLSVELGQRMPFGRTKRAWFWAGTALAAGLMLMIFDWTENRDGDLPNEVALKRQSTAAPSSEPREPLQMRALDLQDGVAGAESQPPPSVAEMSPATDAGRPAMMAAPQREAVESTVLSGGVGGRAAATSGFAPQSADGSVVDGEELLVVRVNLSPAAMRTRAFDATLVNNRLDRRDVADVQTPSADDVESSRTARQEVVLVEAAPAQVRSTLAEMNADTKNYLGIAVEPQSPGSRAAAPQFRFVDEAQQYNRGIVASESQAEVRRYFHDLYRQSGGDRYSVGRESTAEPKSRELDGDMSAAAAARRDRQVDSSTEKVPESLSYSKAIDSDVARRALTKLKSPSDKLQVLFLLQAEDSPATVATPAAEPVAAPAE